MKKCTNCGKELDDNAQFCNGCGAACNLQPQQPPTPPYQQPQTPPPYQPPYQQPMSSQYQQPKKKKTGCLIGIIAGIIAVIVIIFSISCCSYDLGVDVVKDAYLNDYSSVISVGEAFDDFLLDETWERFESDKGDDVVQCNGICTYYGEDAKLEVQFLIKGDNFVVHAMRVDGDELSDADISIVLDTVYESYGL